MKGSAEPADTITIYPLEIQAQDSPSEADVTENSAWRKDQEFYPD